MKRIIREGQLSAEEAAKYATVREQVKKDFPESSPKMNNEIKIGDKVGVQDRRDGVVFEYTHVTGLPDENNFVALATGYKVSTRCCLKVPPEINGHEWEWLQAVYGSCAGSWRCKTCLTSHDMGNGRNVKCESYQKKKS